MRDPFKKLTGIALLWHRIKMRWYRWFPRRDGILQFLRDGPGIEWQPEPMGKEGIRLLTECLEREWAAAHPPIGGNTIGWRMPDREPSNHCKNWLEAAKEYPYEFRKILSMYVHDADITCGMPLEGIYEKFSMGDRYGIWTILNFEKTKDGFLFSEEDIATLSGSGSEWIWKVENGEAVKVKNQGAWMS